MQSETRAWLFLYTTTSSILCWYFKWRTLEYVQFLVYNLEHQRRMLLKVRAIKSCSCSSLMLHDQEPNQNLPYEPLCELNSVCFLGCIVCKRFTAALRCILLLL